jgi:hypothetical protein
LRLETALHTAKRWFGTAGQRLRAVNRTGSIG